MWHNGFLLFLLLAIVSTGYGQASFYGTDDIKVFRDGRDKEFRTLTESPLLPEDRATFSGLQYFPTSSRFRVNADFVKTPDETFFLMPTSSGQSMKYVKAGRLTFDLENKRHTLNVYQSEKAMIDPVWKAKYGHAYFIPFRDQTNGNKTYSVGRYIYLKIPESDKTVIDFNLAFNPSCAYGSDKYSCPTPPKENFLRVEIQAGEKSFAYSTKSVEPKEVKKFK